MLSFITVDSPDRRKEIAAGFETWTEYRRVILITAHVIGAGFLKVRN